MNQKQSHARISREQVKHVADLARLDMDEGSIALFAGQIDNILGHIDSLTSLDAEGVPPMSHALDLTNAFRDDEVGEHLDRKEALSNAPEKEDGNFLVPKIIG